jgi:membrane protein DedA with SNARE-associated domain
MNLIVDFLIDYANGPIPYLVIFLILLACGLGIPIPEDITLFAAGVLTYYGVCDIWTMIVICLFGVMIGDSFVFWLGHHFGRRLLKKWPFRLFLNEDKIDGVRQKLHKHGGKLLFAARFMPGVRSTIFFTTGLLHLPFRNLLIYDGVAALISVPAIVYSVYYFGDLLEHVIQMIKKAELGILAIIIATILFFVIRHYYKKRKT